MNHPKKSASKVVLSMVLLGGCATSSLPLEDTACAPASGVHLDLAAAGARLAMATPPELPSADHLPDRYLDRLGAQASVQVDLCVAPDGSVASVDLVRGTPLAVFDQAVLHDVAKWHFAATSQSSCKRTTIVYRPTRT